MAAAHPRIDTLLREADAAQRAGRAGDAERALQAVLALAPGHPVASNALGMRAMDAGDLDRAEALFRAAAQADPAAPPLWMNLAKVQRLRDDAAGEADSLDRVLRIDQRHFMALVRRAELHERLGQLPQARARYAGVLALAPGLSPTPALQQLVDHAQGVVAAQDAAFAAAITPAVDRARGTLDGRDRRRFDVALDAVLGRRRIYANQCAGLHFPFLPADEFFARDHFPWMPALEARTEAIRAEFLALAAGGLPGFTPYVQQDPGTPDNPWSPLDGSMAWGALHLWKMGQRIDAACDACPATVEAMRDVPLADMPGRAPTVFFSVLRPHTRIPPHTGVSNTRAIVHLPLVVPPACGFRVGGETREWREGEAFAFDDTIEHEAWNDSDQLRAVLILDVWNPHLTAVERALLQTFFEAADASGFDPAGFSDGD